MTYAIFIFDLILTRALFPFKELSDGKTHLRLTQCAFIALEQVLQFLMAKRTVFTTVTALPPGVTRQSVLEALYDHMAMIDLNPLVEECHFIKPPADATPEEYHCRWYQMTDKINYLPVGLYSGRVTYNACFHNLADGLQTHVYAPLGLNIKGRWTVGGSLPGEPRMAVELGLGMPMCGLWLREDVNMKCNIVMTKFVRKTLTKAHARLVDRLLIKAQLAEIRAYNAEMWRRRLYLPLSLPTSPELPLSLFSREPTGIDHTTTLPANDVDRMCFTSTGSAPPIPMRSEVRPSADKHCRSHVQIRPNPNSKINHALELEA